MVPVAALAGRLHGQIAASRTPGSESGKTALANIVIVMTDQQQARCCAREGFPLDTTPFMDRMAKQGKWFDRAYTASPECVPARVSLFTGRYPNAHGIRANPTLRRSAPRYTEDLIDFVRKRGYATALIGKNHSHLKPERMDHWFEFTHNGGQGEKRTGQEKAFDAWLAQLCHRVSEEPTPFPLECQSPYRMVTDAARWIHEVKDQKPFFLFLSTAEPHNPYQVPEPYFSMFPQDKLPPVLAGAEALRKKDFKWQFTRQLGEKVYPNYGKLLPRMRSNYYGMVRLIDDQVKRFVKMLDQEGVLNNTLVFFLSDHGDYAGDYGLMRKGAGVPEDLVRVPFFVCGPGIPPVDKPHPAHVSTVDVFPTVCEAIGFSIPEGVQGRSLWPLLAGKPYPAEEFASAYVEQGFGGLEYGWDDHPDFAKGIRNSCSFDCLNTYSQAGTLRMLRKGDWKLIFNQDGNGELYHLKKDPAELDNGFGRKELSEKTSELLIDLLTWSLRAADPLPLPGGDYERKPQPHNYWHR